MVMVPHRVHVGVAPLARRVSWARESNLEQSKVLRRIEVQIPIRVLFKFADVEVMRHEGGWRCSILRQNLSLPSCRTWELLRLQGTDPGTVQQELHHVPR